MSSLTIDVYIGPCEGKELVKIPELFELLSNNDFQKVKEKYPEFINDELDTFFDEKFSDGCCFTGGDTHFSYSGGVCNFEFLVSTRFDDNEFIRALVALENADSEILIYNDQVGHSGFVKNGTACHFDSCEWKWLTDPDALPFDGEHVVVTGKFEDIDREGMEEVVENCGGVVQKTIGKKTTVLVIGERAGASKLAKAKDLGVRCMNQEQFFDLTEEYF